ncbi:MAG TPA: hypothetical protein VG963_34610, partial [Polyangiaceae bacterium]|nr:hypothetical protein [Polyangiaceae bacterium]
MKVVALTLCLCVAGCAGGRSSERAYQLFGMGGANLAVSGRGAMHVTWSKVLTPPRRGNYRPLENAVAAIDEQNGRVYVGAASGEFHALDFNGRALYRFELHASIESEPALDAEADE